VPHGAHADLRRRNTINGRRAVFHRSPFRLRPSYVPLCSRPEHSPRTHPRGPLQGHHILCEFSRKVLAKLSRIVDAPPTGEARFAYESESLKYPSVGQRFRELVVPILSRHLQLPKTDIQSFAGRRGAKTPPAARHPVGVHATQRQTEGIDQRIALRIIPSYYHQSSIDFGWALA
jgi:hypothetical protein